MAVVMATMVSVLNIDQDSLIPALQAAGEKLNGGGGEVVLDFSAVRRVDSHALEALERLAFIADEKTVKVALRSVNVEVYKVLKLVKLARRFSFPV